MAWAAIAADLAAGFGLLTRLPVDWLLPRDAPWRPGRAAWTYPLAGLVVGAAAAAILKAAERAGLPPLLAAAWAIAGGVLLTGGLHEDGLADTADGFGGGRTPERRLEIMRDSRIGSYGALGLVLSLAIRITALAALPPAAVVASLAAVGAGSRAAMLPLLLLRLARTDGLSHGLGHVPRPALLVGMILALAIILALLPWRSGLRVLLGGALSAGLCAVAAHRRIGGQTGDVLGACAVTAECVILTLLAG